jgi:NAD-dependent SIR2 family protein deacetylase
MKDIFDAEVLCPGCKTRTKKKTGIKEGYRLRFFECPKCSQKIYHPLDIKQYEEFNRLKQREFQVKLRMVGNSFSVTIPKEIIEFEEKFKQMEEEMDRVMRLTLEEPGKINLHFRKLLEE